MKTAISLPDDLFRNAEKSAKRLGVSRSELYARALATYLERQSGAEITAALDRVYGDGESSLDPVLAELQGRVFRSEKW